MWKLLSQPASLLEDNGDDDCSGSSTRLTGSGKERASPETSSIGPSTYGSIVQLSPGHRGDDVDGRGPSWWQRRKQRIFRKKTLYMRIPVLQWLPQYSSNDFFADLVAGITVGVTVIPQALAYATVAGLPPQYGLYSAYIGCFVYLLLGSTRAITVGPTALLSLISHDGVKLMGPQAAVFLSFFSGAVTLLIGLLNFGFLIEFIAAPVIAGFSTAAALTIGTTQVKSLLGLIFDADGFVQTWIAVFEHIKETRTWDAVMGFSSIAALLVLRLFDKIQFGKEGDRSIVQRALTTTFWFLSISRNAIVLIIATVIAACLCTPGNPDNPFLLAGNITSGLPPFQLPPFYIEYNNQTFNFAEICSNFGSAMFVTPLIGILESVAIAKAFARGQKVDASQEMIAIGASNFLGSFVSSYPVTGSFSRTAVNAASGVHTPFGGLYTGSLVLLAITVMTPYFYYIPKACLGAVIITAVIFMIEIHLVKMVWRSRKLDLIPLLITFVVCLFWSLEYGILVGTAVNLAMLLYATARPRIKILHFQGLPAEYLLVTPDRSLVFTAMDYFMSTVRKASVLHPGIPVVIDLSYVSIADFTTAYGFNNLTKEMHKRGHPVVLTRALPGVLNILLGVGPELHVHRDGTDLGILLQEIVAVSEGMKCVSSEPQSR